MNRRRCLLTAIGVALIFAMTIFLTIQEKINAQQAQIIRIYGTTVPKDSIRIEPATLTIPKGSVLVWINWVRAKEVRVIFAEGKKCEDVTESPMGFHLDATKQCYVSSLVPIGTTSSLRFVEAGTFDYTVEAFEGKVKAEGKIIVLESEKE